MSGYELVTQGGNGNTFFIELGDTHPLSVCFSFAEGDPRLSALQAGTVAEAETELAEIGSRCVTAVSVEESEFDVSDVAVGCVLDEGEIAEVCPIPAGLPSFPAATVPPESPVVTDTVPPVATSPPTTTVPEPIPGTPSSLGLTPQEVLTTRLELLHTYPIPSEDPDLIAKGFSTNEDFRLWESVIYQQLLTISNVGPDPSGTDISPEVDGVIINSTDLPEFLGLLADYEMLLNAGGYTFFNTCGSARFPQVKPDSSMIDFFHRDSEPLQPAPLDRPLEWYLEQVAQAAHDNQQSKRIYSNEELPHQLLCEPLINAHEKWIPSNASHIWQPDDNSPGNSYSPPENNDYHVVALSSDRQVALVAFCYVGADAFEYIGVPRILGIVIWEDGKYKLWRDIGHNIQGELYQSCEETATDGGGGFGNVFAEIASINPQLADKTFDTFAFGEHRYQAPDLQPL